MQPLSMSGHAFVTPEAAGASSRAIEAVIQEVSRIAVRFGIPYGQVEEIVKQALVRTAASVRSVPETEALPLSRLSVMTGVHRKDVTRIATDGPKRRRTARISPPNTVVTRWLSDAAWLDPEGRPRPLARRSSATGAPGFDELARSVTRDVNPRTLLDSLCRQGLASLSPDGQEVSLLARAYIPRQDFESVVSISKENLVDHIAAVRENIDAIARSSDRAPASAPYLEQAVFADELSEAGARRAAELATAEWLRVLRELAPRLAGLEDEGKAAGETPTHRIRIGMYCYAAPRDEHAGGAVKTLEGDDE